MAESSSGNTVFARHFAIPSLALGVRGHFWKGKPVINIRLLLLVCLSPFVSFSLAGVGHAQEKEWVVYEGKNGAGKGKHIVLVSGDEEYRSEEALPMLGK